MKKIVLMLGLGLSLFMVSCQKETSVVPYNSYQCCLTTYDTMVVFPNTVSYEYDTFIITDVSRYAAEVRCKSFDKELGFPDNVWVTMNTKDVSKWMTSVYAVLR